MSEYIHIFATDKNNTVFLPLGTWSRSSTIYRLLHTFAPWEKISAVNINMLNTCYKDAQSAISKYQDYIRSNNDKIALVATWNNSVEDKATYVYELQQANIEYEIEISDWKHASSYISFLKDIELTGTSIFVGIECGYNITKDDIVQED